MALTKVVGRDKPFHCTVDPEAKPVPFTVRVKADPPAVIAEGLSVEMDNDGAVTGVPVTAK